MKSAFAWPVALGVAALLLMGAAKTPPTNAVPFGGLKEIEAFSDASARGDQAGMTALLADQILFSAGDGTVQREPKWDHADPAVDLVRKQTQVLRAAAAKGDRAGMDRVLDDSLIYVNEDGVVSGRHDLRLGSLLTEVRPDAATVTLTDWAARRVEGVIVTSYVTNTATRYGQQMVDERALVMDAWIRRGAGWTLVESQSIPLSQDPAPAALEPGVLSEYAGVYSLAPNFVVTITASTDGLALSTNGGNPVVARPEAKDLFFIPAGDTGARRSRIVFQRGDDGRIMGYVSSRGLSLKRVTGGDLAVGSTPPHIGSSVAPASELLVRRLGGLAVTSFIHDRVTQYPGEALHTRYRSTETWIRQAGAWKMLSLQSLELPVDPPVAARLADRMGDYLGEYAPSPDGSVKVVRLGDRLAIAGPGGQPSALQAIAPDVFLIEGKPRLSLLFQRDAGGRVLGFSLRREGRDLGFRKLLSTGSA